MITFFRLFCYELFLHLYKHLLLIGVKHVISQNHIALGGMLSCIEFFLIAELFLWWLDQCCKFYELIIRNYIIGPEPPVQD